MAHVMHGRNDPNPWLLRDLDSRDPRPTDAQIAERIREAIERGDLRPGDLVPGSRLMARRYGVSGATVGRAIRKVAEAGLVRSHHGIGSYVTGGAA